MVRLFGGQDIDEALSTFTLGFFASKVVLRLGEFVRSGTKPGDTDDLLVTVRKLMEKFEKLGSKPQEDVIVDAALETVEDRRRFRLALAEAAATPAPDTGESEKESRQQARAIAQAATAVRKAKLFPRQGSVREEMLTKVLAIRRFFSRLSSMCTAEPDEPFVETEGHVTECVPLNQTW